MRQLTKPGKRVSMPRALPESSWPHQPAHILFIQALVERPCQGRSASILQPSVQADSQDCGLGYQSARLLRQVRLSTLQFGTCRAFKTNTSQTLCSARIAQGQFRVPRPVSGQSALGVKLLAPSLAKDRGTRKGTLPVESMLGRHSSIKAARHHATALGWDLLA